MKLTFALIVAGFIVASGIAGGAQSANSKHPPKVANTDLSTDPAAVDDYITKVQQRLDEAEGSIAKFRAETETLDKSTAAYAAQNQKVDRLERNLTKAQIDAQALRQANRDTWEEQRARLEIRLDKLLSELNEPLSKPAE